MNNVKDFAQKYIQLGWAVHPLILKRKEPATPNGFKDASTATEKIELWFKDNNKNIGIATGQQSGVVVIDIDPKNGGFESFELMKQDYQLDIDTLTVRTGSGGLHLYYQTNQQSKSRIGILPGIDIKGDGGYVVAPPSIHPNGKIYEFNNGLQLDINKMKPYPFEIIERVFKAKKQNKKTALKASEGSRHNFLVSRMGKFRGLGFSQSETSKLLQQENDQNCSPPLSIEELSQISESYKNRDYSEVLFYAPHTDLGNAERFKAYSNGDAIFVEKMQKWHTYDGKRFVQDDGSQIIQFVKRMLRHTRDISSHSNEVGEALLNHLKKTESQSKISALLKLAQTELPFSPSKLDANPYFFNVLNGVIDLRTGQLQPHSKLHYITKLSEIVYDPKATCPLWQKFLSDVTCESIELQNYLQRVVGYCLTGQISEQSFWILFGVGANGKSTFLEIIKLLLGEYGKSSEISTFTISKSEQIRNDLARLFDARLVSSSEIQEGKMLDESTVKQITGGDPVTCRFLFQEHFEYIPKWKLIMAVNHLPIISGTDDGIWRRIKCVPFNAQFKGDQIDRNIAVKLKEEISGILTWAVKGCLLWQSEGLFEPATVSNALTKYRDNEDSLQVFLDEQTVQDVELSVSSTALFISFVEYQKRLGQRVISQKVFGQKMRIRGFESARGVGGRFYYHGIDIKPSGPPFGRF